MNQYDRIFNILIENGRIPTRPSFGQSGKLLPGAKGPSGARMRKLKSGEKPDAPKDLDPKRFRGRTSASEVPSGHELEGKPHRKRLKDAYGDARENAGLGR